MGEEQYFFLLFLSVLFMYTVHFEYLGLCDSLVTVSRYCMLAEGLV